MSELHISLQIPAKVKGACCQMSEFVTARESATRKCHRNLHESGYTFCTALICWGVRTSDSEEHTASIFIGEQQAYRKPTEESECLSIGFDREEESQCSSETAAFLRTILGYNTDDRTFQGHYREKLEFNNVKSNTSSSSKGKVVPVLN
jgi:hypothetical protein